MLSQLAEDAEGTPNEMFYESLCDEFGSGYVDYTQRCMYLRHWKEVHGSYPCKLDYLRLVSLLGIDDERNLRESYDSFELKQQGEEAKIKSKMVSSGSGSGVRNRF